MFERADLRSCAVVTLLLLAGCQTTPRHSAAAEPYFDTGGFHRRVSTTSPDARIWFDRGLVMCYGFNHEEAVRDFERAVAADPRCAMAHWGIAYALGPNINNPQMDDAASQKAYKAVTEARRLAAPSGVEHDLIVALSERYAWPAPDRAELNVAYAEAMREVHEEHPDDTDVAAIFAESLMVLRPWGYWSPDGEQAPETAEIMDVLEGAMVIEPDHPALCHFYIHTMEASPDPRAALAAANRLRNRVPGAGHLVHMPSHIDVLLGHYEDAIIANQKAIVQDGFFVEREGRDNFYTLYRVHNYHFVVYAAMFDGQSEVAMEAARGIVRQIPHDMLVSMSDWLDAFVPTPLHVMVRFGQWEEILAEPEAPAYLPVTRAMRHYARGLAYAATRRVPQAEAEQEAFLAAVAEVPETSTLFQNTSRDILAVAELMLAGEIEYRKGNYDTAFALLEDAVVRDDALNYDEPWGWMQPARHALGALLLEQGRAERAEPVYRADLRRHPNNVWSLHGLAESLRMQGRVAEAATVESRLRQASARCDVEVRASCYCRLGAQPGER